MKRIVCQHLHQPNGWLSPGTLHLDDSGMIVRVSPCDSDDSDDSNDAVTADAVACDRIDGWVVPGMANVHSHAFQRALVGLAEYATPGRDDSFWTWRTAMYRLALAIEPDQLEAVAAQLFVEMLEAGMTAVGEFHYLHHDRDGTPYRDLAETSQRIVAAAHATGIGLTLLPVLYMRGGFAGQANPEQRRFVHDTVDEFLALRAAISMPGRLGRLDRLGVAPHSLRAVPGPALAQLADTIRMSDPRAPIHIHIAEQQGEVDQAMAHLGARPVRWLFDQGDVGPGWCLVHATHLDDGELAQLASSQAVVGLCPTTEANLGDGLFPAPRFLAEGGAVAIGSDSQVTVDLAAELRMLEYGQRLHHQRRNLLISADRDQVGCTASVHVGRTLFDHTARWGGVVIDQPMGALTPGHRADLVVLDGEHPRIFGHGSDTVIDGWIFGAAAGAIRDVYVAGQQVVQDGRHRKRESIATRFRAAMSQLIARG